MNQKIIMVSERAHIFGIREKEHKCFHLCVDVSELQVLLHDIKNKI